MSDRYHRLIFLGAGFSSPAGLPLGDELWQEIQSRIRNSRSAPKFNRAVETYVTYQQECNGFDINQDAIDFEDFLAFLDVEFHLGLRGSDTWSSAGNEVQLMVKWTIGDLLTERTPNGGDIPELYMEFARHLRPGDFVLTFNYDTLLERALESTETPYRLFPYRYKEVGFASHTVDDSRDEVVLIKLHGSVDWFDRAPHLEMWESYRAMGLDEEPNHPVFKTDLDLTVSPILDGPRPSDDPLREMYRVKEEKRVYSESRWWQATPWIMPPSRAKLYYTSRTEDFYRGLGRSGGYNLGCGIIGFSLSEQDEYARQILWRVVKNYQESWWGKDLVGDGRMKTPLALVDLRETPETRKEWRENYRFVDWDRADVWMRGFDKDSLATIFAMS